MQIIRVEIPLQMSNAFRDAQQDQTIEISNLTTVDDDGTTFTTIISLLKLQDGFHVQIARSRGDTDSRKVGPQVIENPEGFYIGALSEMLASVLNVAMHSAGFKGQAFAAQVAPQDKTANIPPMVA